LWVAGVLLTIWSIVVLGIAHFMRRREIDRRVHNYEKKKEAEKAVSKAMSSAKTESSDVVNAK